MTGTCQSASIDRRDLLTGLLAIGAGGAATLLPGEVVAAMAKVAKPSAAFTQGHYQQQQQELTSTNLQVEGAIPSSLSGRYFRNGHNPKPDLIPPYWFAGNGMIHGVRITGGRAEWYRNRFVRTPALLGKPLMRKDGSVACHSLQQLQ